MLLCIRIIRPMNFFYLLLFISSISNATPEKKEVKSVFGITLGVVLSENDVNVDDFKNKETGVAITIESSRNSQWRRYAMPKDIDILLEQGSGNIFYPSTSFPDFLDEFKYFVDDQKRVYMVKAFSKAYYSYSKCYKQLDSLKKSLSDKYGLNTLDLSNSKYKASSLSDWRNKNKYIYTFGCGFVVNPVNQNFVHKLGVAYVDGLLESKYQDKLILEKMELYQDSFHVDLEDI